MKANILVVAQEATLRATLARWLLGAGYGVELAEGAKRAREVIEADSIAVAIMVPAGLGAAGLDLARDLTRSVGRLIIVGAQPGEAGPFLELAADCIPEPLREEDLLARIETAVAPQQTNGDDQSREILRFDVCTIDARGRTCLDTGGNDLPLTRGEFSLLLAFGRHPGQVLSRDALQRAMTGRPVERDDRSVDVLVSRVRRKIEPDPKEPRVIVTVPGEGYKFSARPLPVSGALVPAASHALDTRLRAGAMVPPPSRTPMRAFRTAWIASAGAASAAIAVAAALFWYPGPSSKSTSKHHTVTAERFDAAAIPLIPDAVRAGLASHYPDRPDAKALAISPTGWGVAFGAPDQETANKEALERCATRARRVKLCRLYAVGMNVVWSKASLSLPLPADIHTEPSGAPLIAATVPLLGEQERQDIDRGYVKWQPSKALAISPRSYYASTGRPTRAEAIRLALERCSDIYQTPCLLLSVDGLLTVEIPKSRHIAGLFILATATEMSDQDKERIGHIYREKEWRALARGRNSWHATAAAQSEQAAVEAALHLCAQVDTECRIHAIGNFLVTDEKSTAPDFEAHSGGRRPHGIRHGPVHEGSAR